MRIRKGSQVEVWIQEAASPVGAWRGGEVQWGNGHSYILRWHDGGPDSGRISRKSVRPRPPPAPVPPDMDAGDLVEVFDEEECLWKCAEVEAFDGGRQFRVKVVGAPKALSVASNRLRLRQILRDDDVWVLLHKDNQIAGASAAPLRANGNGFGGNHKPVAPDFNPLKQKRSPCMLDADAITNDKRFQGTQKKKLCVREEPRHDNVEVIEVPKMSPNKQDEIGSNSDSNHDDHRQQQLQNHDKNDDDGDSESVSSSDDSSSDSDESSSDSDESSSDSDGRTRSDDRGGNSDSRTRSGDAGDRASAAPASAPPPPRDEDHRQKADPPRQFPEKDHLDDTAGSWGRPSLNDDERATAQDQVHRLELDAYTALTRAFHASGDALSWEKAELLTDLRPHLHVSNDEHLQVINAVSNRKGRRSGCPGRS